jgi:hypothetical protein
MFPAIHKGICLFCGKLDKVVRLANTPGMAQALTTAIASKLAPADGICNDCSYSLRNVWMTERNELIRASSPRIVLTYLLVPSMLVEHSDVDIAAYEFLTDSTGNVPNIDFYDDERKISKILPWLEKTYGIVTWPVKIKRCYLGFNPMGLFSEVLLVRAWGKSYKHVVETQQVGFLRLLNQVAPEAGFYLGVKSAFEALLWRREAVPAGNELCVVMREAAMRYIAYKSQQEKVPDATSLDLCYGLMSPLEKEIARDVLIDMAKATVTTVVPSHEVIRPEAAREEAARVAAAARSINFDDDVPGDADEDAGEFEPGDEAEDDNRPAVTVDARSVAPGFARKPRSPLVRP